QKGDLVCRPRQPVAAAHTLARRDESRLFEPGKNLGQKARRNALKFGQVATTERRVVIVHKPEQAVDSIFNAGGDMRHNADIITPCILVNPHTEIIWASVSGRRRILSRLFFSAWVMARAAPPVMLRRPTG